MTPIEYVIQNPIGLVVDPHCPGIEHLFQDEREALRVCVSIAGIDEDCAVDVENAPADFAVHFAPGCLNPFLRGARRAAKHSGTSQDGS